MPPSSMLDDCWRASAARKSSVTLEEELIACEGGLNNV